MDSCQVHLAADPRQVEKLFDLRSKRDARRVLNDVKRFDPIAISRGQEDPLLGIP